MATKPIAAGLPANPWFEKDLKRQEKTKVNDITIQIIYLLSL
jgi:hypothetical protein